MADRMKEFVRERDEAFTAAVVNDDWDKVRAYCRKYHVAMPKDERVMKAGIYKAVQECTGIPREVKNVALAKCVSMGFKPYIGGVIHV